jgi:hypothetical protein
LPVGALSPRRNSLENKVIVDEEDFSQLLDKVSKHLNESVEVEKTPKNKK